MTSFSERLGSDIFEIIAESGRKFSVHGNLLAAQSKSLATIVTRASKEATERKIDFLDWDGDTVGRFVDFLYLGNYQVPEQEPPSPIEDSVASSSGDFSQQAVYTPDTTHSPSSLNIRFGSTLCGGVPTTDSDRLFTPVRQFHESPVTDRKQNDSMDRFFYNQSVFLTHAKVYALAQLQGVEALERLSLRRLIETLIPLQSIDSNSPLAADIVQLLKYVYRHTKSPGPASGEEPMREVVSQFSAFNFSALQRMDDMKEVIQHGGELMKDVVDKVCRRLVHLEDRLAASQAALLKREDDADKLQTKQQQMIMANHNLERILEIETSAKDEAELYLAEIQKMLTAQMKPTKEEMEKWFRYQYVQVITQNNFKAHQGFDLANWDDVEQPKEAKPKMYRILRSAPVQKLVEEVASDLGDLDASTVRLWVVVKRLNKTLRPSYPLTPLEITIGDAIKKHASTYLRLWAEILTDVGPTEITGQWDTSHESIWILVLLKHYDAEARTLRGVGHLYVRRKGLIEDLKPAIASQMGWTLGQPIKLYKEVRPQMIEPIKLKWSIQRAGIEDGDIICFQKSYTTAEEDRLMTNGLIPNAKDFYQYLWETS